MARDAAKDKADKAKDKEREAKRKEKEKAAKAKAKEKAAKVKAKEKAVKEKEKAAKAKAKDKAAAAKAKDKAAAAKAKDKAAAAKAKDKAKAAKPEAAPAAPAEPTDTQPEAPEQTRRPAPVPEAPVEQPVEEVAVPERGETTEVPDDATEEPAEVAALVVPDSDKTVRPKGYLAEALGKEDAVERSTQRATLAASYTTRDHELIQAWAHTRNGRPADVKGTAGRRRGPGTAGVLRIEFPDGPGDDSRLEDVDWAPFFETFDASDVDFLYQERVRTGDISRFHKFVRTAS